MIGLPGEGEVAAGFEGFVGVAEEVLDCDSAAEGAAAEDVGDEAAFGGGEQGDDEHASGDEDDDGAGGPAAGEGACGSGTTALRAVPSIPERPPMLPAMMRRVESLSVQNRAATEGMTRSATTRTTPTAGRPTTVQTHTSAMSTRSRRSVGQPWPAAKVVSKQSSLNSL